MLLGAYRGCCNTNERRRKLDTDNYHNLFDQFRVGPIFLFCLYSTECHGPWLGAPTTQTAALSEVTFDPTEVPKSAIVSTGFTWDYLGKKGNSRVNKLEQMKWQIASFFTDKTKNPSTLGIFPSEFFEWVFIVILGAILPCAEGQCNSCVTLNTQSTLYWNILQFLLLYRFPSTLPTHFSCPPHFSWSVFPFRLSAGGGKGLPFTLHNGVPNLVKASKYLTLFLLCHSHVQQSSSSIVTLTW